MRTVILAAAALLSLGACSTAPRPMVPDAPDGPGSYVCYSTLTSTPNEVRAIAEGQCSRWGMQVKNLIGQAWAPLRCGLLTPTVAGFRCSRPDSMGFFDSTR